MKIFLTLGLVLLAVLNYAQDLKNHVPTLASPVVQINSQSIHEKCNAAAIGSYEFYKELKSNAAEFLKGARVEEELVPLLFANAESFGLSKADRAYLFVRRRDSINYTAFLSKIASEEGLNETIKTIIKDEDDIEHGIGEGFQFVHNKRMAIAWNSSMVAFLDYRMPYYYSWSSEFEVEMELEEEYYESYDERFEAEEEKKKERRKEVLLGALEEIFNPNPDHTIAGNEHFKKATEQNADVTIFMDAMGQMGSNMGSLGMFRRSSDMQQMLSTFADSYSYFHFNLNESSAKVKGHYHVGDRFHDMVADANKGKFDKDLFKYIDGNNLIGYFGMAVDPEPTYEFVMEMYQSIFSGIPEYGETAAAGIGIFEILLDEEEVFDLIHGNMIFAVTDIRQFDVSYTSYEYDDEFNESEVTKTKKELLPEYVFVASVGNEDLRNKILKIYEGSEMLIPMDGYYRYKSFMSRYSRMLQTESEENDMYVAVQGDVLIITNNKELVTTYRENGLPSDRRMSKDRLKHFKKNNYLGYWDAANTINKISGDVKESIGEDFFTLIDEAKGILSGAELNGVEVEDGMFTNTLTVDFQNKETPAVAQLLELIEKIYRLEK